MICPYGPFVLREHRTYETNKKAVGQTDAEKRSDLFRVHLLRRFGLIARDYLTPSTPG